MEETPEEIWARAIDLDSEAARARSAGEPGVAALIERRAQDVWLEYAAAVEDDNR